MNIYTTFKAFTGPGPDSAVALGLFDGVHLGHQRVLNSAISHRPSLQAVALTFSLSTKRPDKKKLQKDILTVSDRLARLENLGLDAVYIPPFEEVSSLSPQVFFTEILLKHLHIKVICCGQDYHFGSGALGDVSLLQQLCTQHRVILEIIPPVLDEEQPVSSTRIRHCLKNGDMATANRLLGFPYFINQKISYGKQLGRNLGFPTINQKIDSHICVPKWGVYYSLTEIKGILYPSLTNIGINPSVETANRPIAETHILNFQGDLYGQCLQVKLLAFLRSEKKFKNLSLLQQAMEQDKKQAVEYFSF